MTGKITVNCTSAVKKKEEETNGEEVIMENFFCLNYDAFVKIATRSINNNRMKTTFFVCVFGYYIDKCAHLNK